MFCEAGTHPSCYRNHKRPFQSACSQIRMEIDLLADALLNSS
jgi:hypothetical protein